jgi:hypothetical protein
VCWTSFRPRVIDPFVKCFAEIIFIGCSRIAAQNVEMNWTMSDSELSARIVADHFMGDRPVRYIAGDAVSSTFIDCRGISFEPRGLVKPELPLPLLIGHAGERPVGRVTHIDQIGNQVKFVGQLCNSGRLCWADEAWRKILAGDLFRVSICGKSVDPIRTNAILFWRLSEISLTEEALDPDARITRCWEELPFVYLDNRPSQKTFWSTT